jgi:hypothetical protein
MILNSPTISGSLTVTGNIIASGSITLSGSVASASYADTASFVALAQSASNAVSAATASFANAFTVASTLTAQTLVVQTITSSVDFVTGSTRFGSSLSTSTHQFTGSVSITGSLAVVTTGTEFQVTNTGVNFGNVIGDAHNITGSVGISGSLSGSSATFSGNLNQNAPIFIDNSNHELASFSNNNLQLFFGSFYDGTNIIAKSGAGGRIVMNGGSFSFQTFGSATTGSAVTPTERFLIANDGAATFSSSVTAASGNFTVNDAATNSVLDILTLTHTTSGTAASGLGAGILFRAERPSSGIVLNRGAIYGVSGTDPDDNGDLAFYTLTNTGASGFSEKMRIKGSGNVGIGTSSPVQKLQVDSTSGDGIYLSSFLTTSGAADTGATLFFGVFDGSVNRDACNIKGLKENGTSGNYATYLSFGTRANGGSPTERMRITSGGNVGIGTNSPEALANNTTLQIDGTSHSFVRTGTSNYGGYFFTIPTADAMGLSSVRNPVAGTFSNTGKAGSAIVLYGTSGDGYMTFSTSNANNTAPTERMRITSNGNVNLNDTVYNNTAVATTRTLYIGSDYRIGGISSIRESKKNINDISSVDWIYSLNPVTFNYRKKDEEEKYTEEVYDELVYGLIAEDTQPIADFLINYNSKEDGSKEMIGIEYSRLITPMLKAIQELKTQNDALQSRIETLESK